MKAAKFWILLVCMIACLTLLTACGDGDGEGGDPSAPQQEALTLLENGESAYKIVYAKEGEAWEKAFATRLQNSIFAVTGVKIPVVDDTESTADKNAKEIVIGTSNSNRFSTYASTKEIDYGFRVFPDGGRLIFDVRSKTGAYFALCAVCKDWFEVDLEAGETLYSNSNMTTLTVAADYSSHRQIGSVELPYIGIPLAQYEIAVNTEDYLLFSLANELSREINYRMKVELNLYDSYWGLEKDRAYIVIEEDGALAPGRYSIGVKEAGRIEITASDYYGFTAAIEAFPKLCNAEQFIPLRLYEVIEGDYVETVGQNELSATYAYEKQGECRVMFYNVLWGDNYYGEIFYNAEKRDPFEVALIDLYRPDVLGLQEVNNSRRGINNRSNLIGKLETLGYVEAIDPRVENMKAVEDGGYGIGGYKVTREDGSVYYTYYNCAPLLYDKSTTKCIESGYHWYTEQLNEGWNVGLGDCASKALSWGVFESLQTGERYIVISTHMRGGDVSLSQAREAVAVVDSLLEKYPTLPVFFGGDLNTKEGEAGYDYFVGDEVGYGSIQHHKLATEFCSGIKTDHGYPQYVDGMMTVGTGLVMKNVDPNTGLHRSIDNIFVTNHEENTSLNVFGVVVDFCSLRGSDHLPIFIDFDLLENNEK